MVKNAALNNVMLLILAALCAAACFTPWYMISMKIPAGQGVVNYWLFPWNIAVSSGTDVEPGFISYFESDLTTSYDNSMALRMLLKDADDLTLFRRIIMGSFLLAAFCAILCLFGMILACVAKNVSWIYFIVMLSSAVTWIAVGLAGPEFIKFYDNSPIFEYVGLGLASALMFLTSVCAALMLCCVPHPRHRDTLPK